MKRILIAPVRFYQRFISPAFPASCRFEPTCSNYMIEAIEKHGFKGVLMGFARILRCHPWSKTGKDPVSDHFSLKRNQEEKWGWAKRLQNYKTALYQVYKTLIWCGLSWKDWLTFLFKLSFCPTSRQSLDMAVFCSFRMSNIQMIQSVFGASYILYALGMIRITILVIDYILFVKLDIVLLMLRINGDFDYLHFISFCK